MSIGLIVVMFAIGFIGSFLSGMLGIGGAVINYPLLLFVPLLVGVGSFSAHEVSGMIAVQVFFSTLSGVVALRKEKLIHIRLVAYMGSTIIVGSLLGGYGGQFLSGHVVNVVYAILATIAAVMMFIPNKGTLDDKRSPTEVMFPPVPAVLSAFVVGTASGIVGAGGAFLLVPIMLRILKLPTRMTIASSLMITLLSSIGSMAGKLMAGHILLGPSVTLVTAGILAAPLGALAGKKANPRMLQAVLSILILGTAIKIWFDLLLQ